MSRFAFWDRQSVARKGLPGYTPSMAIVRELARVHLGEPERDAVARHACRLRGFVDRTGALTDDGARVLDRSTEQNQLWEARRG